MSKFEFKDLSESIRVLMIGELLQDGHANKVYVSKRLTEEGQGMFRGLLYEALLGQTNEWLAMALKQEKFWKTHEFRHHQTQGIVEAKIPSNASEVLSDTEFNRYYMRAVCLRAIEAGVNVIVYRARETSRPRSGHQELIGKSFVASECLKALREGSSELMVPNSGLSLTM